MRVAGVKVGKVTGVSLDGDQVKVTFEVRHTWIGDASTAAIGIKTLLGEKYLAVDPLGSGRQDPDDTHPEDPHHLPVRRHAGVQRPRRRPSARSTPGSSRRASRRSPTPSRTPRPRCAAPPPDCRRCRRTISSRDAQLADLLSGSKQLTKTLSDQNGRFQSLISDGDLLLGEIQKRRDAIHTLLTGTQNLGVQLNGLVADNSRQLAPTLDALDRVTGVLLTNQSSLDKALALAGPYYRVVGNTLGNGRWFDSYLCGLVPKNYLPTGTPPADRVQPPKATGAAS